MTANNKTQEEQFIQAYIHCAQWAENLEMHELAKETTEKLTDIARQFFWHNLLIINKTKEEYTYAQAGNDLWLTQNGHGVGYWDRELGEVGDKLTELAQAVGARDLYQGDDGLLYVT